jgi:4-alpha-glucanotransferase
MEFTRSSGILLHPTSLPGRFGIGDFGDEAYRFIDFMSEGGQTLWQILPLGPPTFGNSPYQCFSAFAGNTLMISPERLVEIGLLSKEDLADAPKFPRERIGWKRVTEFKNGLLEKAVENFRRGDFPKIRQDLDGFRHYAAGWLADYSLFAALKDEHQGKEWNTWEAGLAGRERKAIEEARGRLKDRIEAQELLQYLFFRQWLELKKYANGKGIKVIGDMPIFVAHNSADVWANPALFKLDDAGDPMVVAGVPPDLFSKTGQLWGNPVYDWDEVRARGFGWWVSRMRETLKTVDIVRVDHFRGFAATWEVPAGDETAEQGEWVEVPGRELFQALKKALGDLPVLAEDLGTITPDVIELRDELGLPGMRVLQFAFSAGPQDTHLPHNYVHNTVVYTGTHDNDTVVGWYNSAADEGSTRDEKQIERERDYARKYLNTDASQINWDFIRAAMASVADIAIIPLQDVLGLDSTARMNIPASEEGNWGWRFRAEMLKADLSKRLREMTGVYGRAPSV